MAPPTLDIGRHFLQAEPPPGILLQCAITGSHLYGFATPKSDLDLKGIHLAPAAHVLGLGPLPETHDRQGKLHGIACDLTTHEAGVAVGLMLKGNGNVLERIMSPHQLGDPAASSALQDLVPQALSRRCFGHYRGYFRGMQREFHRQGKLKSLLATYRVALTGLHLLRTAEVLTHLPTLAKIHDLSELVDLIARRVDGDADPLTEAEITRWTQGWPALEARLEAARDQSVLPEHPVGRAACNAWLIQTRTEALLP